MKIFIFLLLLCAAFTQEAVQITKVSTDPNKFGEPMSGSINGGT